jgi:membrane protein YdbS with pleckstrin-like domain
MINWINRINLFSAFVLLLGFHALLYYSQGTPNWFFVSLMATVVDTAILAGLQFVLRGIRREKGR